MEWIRWWHKLMMMKNTKFAKLLLLMASEWYDCLYSCHLIVISLIYYTGRNSSRFAWFLTLMVLSGMAVLGGAGYIFYKYRLRVSSPYMSISDNGPWTGVAYWKMAHVHWEDVWFYNDIRWVLQSYMDSEIMAIMSQYMPLDNQNNEVQPLRQSAV